MKCEKCDEQRKTETMKTSTYKDGTSQSNPVKVFDDSQAFDVCRERNQPVWVRVEETGELYKAYPSGYAVKPTWVSA